MPIFSAELTRGPSWRAPEETLTHREIDAPSIAAATSEAAQWLRATQKNEPGLGVTHFRIITQSGTVIGGPG